jgi:hypothetical protein
MAQIIEMSDFQPGFSNQKEVMICFGRQDLSRLIGHETHTFVAEEAVKPKIPFPAIDCLVRRWTDAMVTF